MTSRARSGIMDFLLATRMFRKESKIAHDMQSDGFGEKYQELVFKNTAMFC